MNDAPGQAAPRPARRPWRVALAEHARRFARGRPVEPEVQRAFEAYCDDLMGRASPWLLTFFIVVVVAWWPTDALLYAGQPRAQRALFTIRALIVIAHVFWLTLGRRALRRRPARWGTFIAVSEAWMLGAMAGVVGGLDTPWGYYLFIWPLASVGLARPLWDRMARVTVLGMGALACYVVASGTPLDDPRLPPAVSYMLFCCLFCGLVGHGMWLLLRENFVQRRLIESQRQRLDGFRQELEQQVAAQTSDLQVLSRRLETLREEERGWMARELHDALGQELTAARYALDLVRTRLSGADARVDGALVDIHRRLGLAHESVRRILQRLRPRVLDELGLSAALSWLADDTAARSGLTVAFTADMPEGRLPPPTETALYRVAQEAIVNVLRHAEASAIDVRLAVADGRCTLQVRDDGVGIGGETSGASDTSGVGCIGIRERIAALGGLAEWRAPAGGGTLVHIDVPLEEP